MELKHRLLLAARDRLANLPGAIERFEADMAGPRLLAEAGALPEVYRQAELLGNTNATAAIQAHLTGIIDRWARTLPMPAAMQPLEIGGPASAIPEVVKRGSPLTGPAVRPDLSHTAAIHEEGGSPITTDQLCDGFDGLRWTSLEWRKTINKRVPGWLRACKATDGVGGASSVQATWWPIKVALALAAKLPRGPAPTVHEIDRAFRSKTALRPWTKAWFAYREDHPELG